MFSKTSIFLVVFGLSCIRCEPPPSTSYGTPLGAPLNSYGTPNYDANNHDHHDYGEPKSYEFGYQVKDDYSGNNYNRKESSDGNQVRGEYRVQLPDGRTQIVTYYADWQTGFHADVRYEGTAHYPDQYNNNNNNNNYNGGYNNNDLSNQYGPPGYNNNNNNGYNSGYSNNNNGYNGGYNNNNNFNNDNPATSSVTIKDYSSNNNYNEGYNYDSYNNGFSNKPRPSNEYGAP